MTQRERVLEMLQKAGGQGVTSNDFFAAFMPRYSARIHELRTDGYRIDKEPVEDGFFRYHLVAAPPQCGKRDLPPVAVLDSPQQITSVGAGRSLAPASLPSSSPGPCSRASTAGASRGQAEVAGRDVESGFSHKPKSEVTGFEPVPLFELPSTSYQDAA